MTELFEIRLSGSPDRRELDRLRKLLNFRPRGRLDDIEDAEFGHRYLRDTPGEGVTLSLWRRTNGDWTINLGYRGDPPPVDLVDRVCAESVEAATRAGLGLIEVVPSDRRTTLGPDLLSRIPHRPVLTLPLADISADGRGVTAMDTVHTALGLRREYGGDSGAERGWRYLQRDPSGLVLLQLLWTFQADTADIVVLADEHTTPDPATLWGCQLQTAAAAAMAGLVAGQPHPSIPGPDPLPASATARLEDLRSLDELWQRHPAHTRDRELARGLLLTALAHYNSPTHASPLNLGIERVLPKPGLIPDTVRAQAEDFLLASQKLIEIPSSGIALNDPA